MVEHENLSQILPLDSAAHIFEVIPILSMTPHFNLYWFQIYTHWFALFNTQVLLQCLYSDLYVFICPCMRPWHLDIIHTAGGSEWANIHPRHSASALAPHRAVCWVPCSTLYTHNCTTHPPKKHHCEVCGQRHSGGTHHLGVGLWGQDKGAVYRLGRSGKQREYLHIPPMGVVWRGWLIQGSWESRLRKAWPTKQTPVKC